MKISMLYHMNNTFSKSCCLDICRCAFNKEMALPVAIENTPDKESTTDN